MFLSQVLTVSTENLLPANPEILDGVDDLIQLSYLNEPSVINSLQCRYSQNKIYVRIGVNKFSLTFSLSTICFYLC